MRHRIHEFFLTTVPMFFLLFFESALVEIEKVPGNPYSPIVPMCKFDTKQSKVSMDLFLLERPGWENTISKANLLLLTPNELSFGFVLRKLSYYSMGRIPFHANFSR